MIKTYYIQRKGKKIGPLDYNDFENQTILEDDLIWYDGVDDWTLATDDSYFQNNVSKKPPESEREKLLKRFKKYTFKGLIYYIIFSVIIGVVAGFKELYDYKDFMSKITKTEFKNDNNYNGGLQSYSDVKFTDIRVYKDGKYVTRWSKFYTSRPGDNEQVSYEDTHKFLLRPYRALFSVANLSSEERNNNLVLCQNFVLSSLVTNIPLYIIGLLFFTFRSKNNNPSKKKSKKQKTPANSINQNLEKTSEYRALKQLLENGIISNEEFHKKVVKLKSKLGNSGEPEITISEEQKIKNKLYFLNQEFKANKISKEGFDRRRKQIENELDVLNFEKTTAYKNLHASYNSGTIHNSDYISKYDEAFKAFKDKLKKDKEEAKKEKINYRYTAFLFVFIFAFPFLLFKTLEVYNVDDIILLSITIFYVLCFTTIYFVKKLKFRFISVILYSLLLIIFNYDYSGLSSKSENKKTSVSTNVKKNKTPKVKIDLKQKTIDFFEAENNRDMYKILDFFAYKKTKRYFDIYNPTYSDLGSEYRRQWKLSKSSNNEIIYVHKIKDREYKAKVKFTYTDKSYTKREVINTLQIEYNTNNKIVEIYTIDSYKVPYSEKQKNSKIDTEYNGYYIEKASIDVEFEVRNEPSVRADIVYMCPTTSIIYITEYTNSKYYKVYVDGYVGYMPKYFLKKIE